VPHACDAPPPVCLAKGSTTLRDQWKESDRFSQENVYRRLFEALGQGPTLMTTPTAPHVPPTPPDKG
jgi:hypothetical protein